VAAAPEGDAPAAPARPRIVSVGPGGFLRQGPGDQQAPIPPAPPRRLVPARPSPEIADKTSLLDLNDRICRWPMGHPGEPDFHFCGEKVNPGFPYCVEHCGRAYQAQLPRGARRPPPPLPLAVPVCADRDRVIPQQQCRSPRGCGVVVPASNSFMTRQAYRLRSTQRRCDTTSDLCVEAKNRTAASDRTTYGVSC
jgi:hypothetical protein